MIARYRTNFPEVPARCEPVQNTHFDEASFDAVVAWGLLSHLNEREQETVIRKVSDWLEPDGLFLFTSGPAAGGRVGEMGGIEFRYRSLGVDTYRKVLEEAGMRLHDHHATSGTTTSNSRAKGESPFVFQPRVAEESVPGRRTAWLKLVKLWTGTNHRRVRRLQDRFFVPVPNFQDRFLLPNGY